MKNELNSKRLQLSPVGSQDCDRIHAMLLHPVVKKYLCDDRDLERSFVENLIAESTALFAQKGVGLWLITGRSDGVLKGFCGIVISDIPEIIYVIHPDFQKQGFATESARRVMEFYHQLYPESALYARVDLPNAPSHVVARRLGMKAVGTEKNLVTGGDMQVYKSEWRRSPARRILFSCF